MTRIIAAALLAGMSGCHPAVAQSGPPAGPSVTMQAPCAPAEVAASALKRGGYVRVVKGRDVDGDPFAVFRRPDGEWRAVAFVTMGGGVWACSIIGGEGLTVGDAGEGA